MTMSAMPAPALEAETTAARRALAQTYRDLAVRCRVMAERARQPASLVQRAGQFDAIAADIERSTGTAS